MRLPKGASYKIISTKGISMDSLLEDLASQGFAGYVRITVEREKRIEDGYLLLKEGCVVGAEFESEETFFSKKAYDEIKKAWRLEGIVDIYKFTDFQIQLSIEENEEALLNVPAKKAPKEKPVVKEKEKAKPLEPAEVQKRPAAPVEKQPPISVEEIKTPPEPLEVSEEPERSVAENIIEKRKERLELLKKFGLREPEDDFVDAILHGFNLPSEKELSDKSRELKKEILSRLKRTANLEELDLYINPAKLDRAVEFNIDVYVKPLNREIEEEVKSTIEKTLKEKLTFPYEKGLTFNEV